MIGSKPVFLFSRYLNLQIVKAMVLVGLAYYFGALVAIHQTITPEGIAILWPPNAILLAAFLIYPKHYLPFVAIAGIIAELKVVRILISKTLKMVHVFYFLRHFYRLHSPGFLELSSMY